MVEALSVRFEAEIVVPIPSPPFLHKKAVSTEEAKAVDLKLGHLGAPGRRNPATYPGLTTFLTDQ